MTLLLLLTTTTLMLVSRLCPSGNLLTWESTVSLTFIHCVWRCLPALVICFYGYSIILSSSEHKVHMSRCMGCFISVVCPSFTTYFYRNVSNESAHYQGYKPVCLTKGDNICYIIRRFNFLIVPDEGAVRCRNIYSCLKSAQTSFQKFFAEKSIGLVHI
jgi:hypothetical protein